MTIEEQKASNRLIERGKHIDEALLFRDTDLVKAVTGIRRCGGGRQSPPVRIELAGADGE